MKKYVCTRCGNDDVEVRVWWNPNTQEVGSTCDDNDAWCNVCEEHCRLEEKVNQDEPDLTNKYIVVEWPEIQYLMVDGFDDNAVLINDEKGLEDFGSSAYFVKAEWARSVLNQENRNASSLGELYVYVSWPDSQNYEDIDSFEENAYPNSEGDGWFVSCEWLEKIQLL